MIKLKISKTAGLSTQVIFYMKGKTSIPDFDGEKNEISVVYKSGKTYINCGLGEEKAITPNIVRTAAATAAQKAKELKRKDISVIIPPDGKDTKLWRPALEGLLLGAYKFTKYKSEQGTELTSIEAVGEGIPQEEADKVITVCECVCLARDLSNENAHVIYPQTFAKHAGDIAKKGGIKLTVLNEKELIKKGMGLLMAVGQGSPFPPRLVIMEYRNNPGSKDVTAIVGKGITFDSGGQNLKPTGSIETMRHDMAGAAAVLATMKALSIIKPKINVTGVCALAHNAIGQFSYFPGDIYRSFSGKTVEICNTDAEGRLILADAIAYCKKTYKPTSLIDIATLTGGVITALGDRVAGLFSNNREMAQKLFSAGEITGERLWEFPIYEDYSDTMKSDIADLRNTTNKKKGWASSITGAAFIKEFTGDTPWAHLDIAGTAFNEEGPRGEIPQYATGFGVRLFMEYLTGSSLTPPNI
jgi:leucyl aminopeptidase